MPKVKRQSQNQRREKGKQRKNETRREESKRVQEQMADTEARRKARLDCEIRTQEQLANTEARRKARMDCEIRTQEQLADTEARRNTRMDCEIRTQEQLANTEARRKTRMDCEIRTQEQLADTEARRKARLEKEVRSVEQIRDTLAHVIAREKYGVCEFLKAIKDGPTKACDCCDGLYFSSSTKKINIFTIDKFGEDFVKKVLRDKGKSRKVTMCSTCHGHVTKGKVPKLCFSNGFEFPEIPNVLKGLTQLEERLVAARIPFMAITKLGVDRQCGLRGNVVNVVNPINETAQILPRTFSDASVIQLMLMRRMEYKHPYLFETIRVKKVVDAAKYLCETPLYRDENIIFSDEWIKLMDKDVIEFVVDERDNYHQHQEPNELIAMDKEELNPGGQQTLLIDFDAIENSEAIKFAPGEGQRPISLLMDLNAESLSFPTIYAGQRREMKDPKITRTDIAKSDARNKDRRCATPAKLLYSFKLSQTYQIASQVQLCLRKKKGHGKPTAGNLLNAQFVEHLVQHDDGYNLLKNIRSSPPYWQDRQKVLMAMIRQFGIPTLFITLSAAEVKWPELIVILKKILEGTTITEEEAKAMSWEFKADLIRRDPITCSRYFDYRLRQCNKYLLLNRNGVFKDHPIIDFFTRIEFQHRGSPHMHGLFWLKDAPKYDENDTKSVQSCEAFIDKYISCASDVDGVIHQRHKHTSCCEVKFKGSTKCRFGMPYPPMPSTRILVPFPLDYPTNLKAMAADYLQVIKDQVQYLVSNDVDLDFESFLNYLGMDEKQYIMAIRSGLNRPTVFLKRPLRDAFFNAYNTQLAQCWKANMDIQFVLDPYACCKYVAAYVSKSCRGMSELLKKVVEEVKQGNLSCKEKLKRFSQVFLNGSEVSAQEAAYSVLSMPLSRCSRDSIYINTSPASERVYLTKSEKELRSLPEDSTDVTIEGLMNHYSERPHELETSTLAEFAAWWTFYTKEKKNKHVGEKHEDEFEDEENEIQDEVKTYKQLNGKGNIRKRGMARVIRYRNYGELEDPDNFYREQLMLFRPWRDESVDILEMQLEHTYLKYIREIETVRSNFDRRVNLEELEELINNCELEDNYEELLIDDEYEVIHGPEFKSDFGLEVGDGYNEKAQKLKMPNMMDDSAYFNLIGKLNEKQRMYHNHITMNLTRMEVPFYEFISGGAGVGKSMLITAITQTIIRNSINVPGKDPSKIKVLLCASTGVAAFNIGGYTLHQAFGLPFSQFDGVMPRLSESNRNKMANEYEDLQLIVADEISMTSLEQLFQLDDRSRQIFKTNSDFGGKPILVVGDFNQLEPVMASWIFAEPKKGQSAISTNCLWPKFQYFELTECMRQKGDIAFAEALNRLAVGKCTEEDVIMFKSREIKNLKQTPPDSAIRLKYSNDDVDCHNERALQMMDTEGIIAHANDRVQGRGKHEHHEAIRNAAKKLPTKKAQNLPATVNFKVGAKYMMTINVDTADGLVNGAIGKLRKITYGKTTSGTKVPLKVWMEFPKNVGTKLKSKRKNNIPGMENLVPIVPESRSIHKWPGRNLEVIRIQFAFVPAESITIHKSQGSTFDVVVVSMQYNTRNGRVRTIPRRAMYVAFSRCTSITGLYIDGEFHPPEPPSADDKVVLEMEKLRSRPIIFKGEDSVQNDLYKPKNVLSTPLTEKLEKFCTTEADGVQQMTTMNTQIEVNIDNNMFYKLGPYFGALTSFVRFKEGSKLDDADMNAIGYDIIAQNGSIQAHYIDSLFMENKTLFQPSKIAEIDKNLYYIFLNPGHEHWILAEIDTAKKIVTTFDSLPSYTERFYEALINKLKHNLEEVGVNSKHMFVQKEATCSKQTNGVDCGPMALMFLQKRCAGVSMDGITKEVTNAYRRACALKLISTTITLNLFEKNSRDITKMLEYCSKLV